MPVYKTPDVYVEEISTLPPSVAEVSTAIPAFIGYTAFDTLSFVPTRITSFLEFTTLFGGAAPIPFAASVAGGIPTISIDAKDTMRDHKMYYALDLYFKNGGSDCYIVSLGAYGEKMKDDFSKGIDALKTEDEPTLIILSEATTLTGDDYYPLCQQALQQCADLQDRFCIFDLLPSQNGSDSVQDFRNNIGMNNLSYGAAYYPYLNTSLNYAYDESKVTVTVDDNSLPVRLAAEGFDIVSTKALAANYNPSAVISTTNDKSVSFDIAADSNTLTISAPQGKTAQDVISAWKNFSDPLKANYDIIVTDAGKQVKALNSTKITSPITSLAGIKQYRPTLYNSIKQELSKSRVVLPPASAIAGIYATIDRTRGVWKAPANVSLNSVIGPALKISNTAQENLNEDPTGSGKSINAIRSFIGKGTLVWGARTLDGSSNDWRYVPVRRLFIMIEESAKKASYFAVFEPNDAATWLKVKGMIESFLYGLWQQGALAGATSKAAYYVNVGLGTTMTQQDILEGRMIVEIGIAAVRPAEFIILRFSHKMQEV